MGFNSAFKGLTFTAHLQPVGLFDPADEGTRTPRNIRNYVNSNTAKYPTTFKSQELFIGYNSPLCLSVCLSVCLCVCVCVCVCLVRLTIYPVPYIHRIAERIATALLWVITQRVAITPYRRFRTSYRMMRNNPEGRSSHPLRSGNLKPRRCDDLEMNSADNSNYQPTHRPF